MLFLVAAFNDREARAWANDHNIDNWKLITDNEMLEGLKDQTVVELTNFKYRQDHASLWSRINEKVLTHNFRIVPSYDPMQE